MQDGSGLGMDIREIESIIDVEHKNHPLFQAGKEQTVYDLLTSFEDICGLILIGGTLNPTVLRKITDQMDALNTALLWTNQLCSANPEPIKTDLTELRYAQCCDLLNNYAYPYSVICSGYISYSRHRFSAEIDGNAIRLRNCTIIQSEDELINYIEANSRLTAKKVQVFNVDITDAVDLFCCVVAKHNIRTQHKYVPVIDLKRMEELLESYSLNTVFHMVRNHEYEIPFPKGATIAHQTIRYAGFEFRVPAICFDSLQI